MATSADAIANASTGTLSVSASVTVIENVPDNKVGLRFLLISGKKTDLLVDPNATLDFVKKAIYEAWPQEWTNEMPAGAAQLRILYLGRMLDNASTVEAAKLPLGQMTIVHLLLSGGGNTGPNSPDKKKVDQETGGGGGGCCVIL